MDMTEDRYSRLVLFSPIGHVGLNKLSSKHVLIIGAGALGTANAESLVRTGIGELTIVDRDYVEWSNLSRQQLYSESDAVARLPKAIAAENRLRQINSKMIVKGIVADVTINEIMDLLHNEVDLIIDATDNFDIRLIINDAAQKYGIPWIYGACVGSYGLSYTIIPGKTPCLNCLLESIPIGGPTCDTVGIIPSTVQMVAAHQTTEAMKILVEDFDALRQSFETFDLWKNQSASIKVDKMKKDHCPSCGTNPTFPYLYASNLTKTAVLCGRDTVQIRPATMKMRDLDELANLLKSHPGKIEKNPYLLSFTIQDHRLVVFKDGRVLVHGTKDIAEAKSLYYRFLG